MATISNTPRPGYVWDATDNVWYPIGVGGHGHSDYITQATAISPTTVDAKGDLLVGSAADTISRLAVGNSGEQIVADSSTSTGLRYQAPKTQNAVYNSGFDIAQRGTSFTGLSGADNTLDRWVMWAQTGGQSNYASQQSAGNLSVSPTQVIRYCGRFGRTAATTNVGTRAIFQTLETSDSIRFAGQTITMSFYARAGANFSATAGNLGFQLISGTSTDVIYYNFTGAVSVASGTAVLTTSWQRFTCTGTVGTTATQLAVFANFTPVGTAGAADYVEITGVQLEVGSVATPFNRMSGSIQGELAACQRYYQLVASGDSAALVPGAIYGANNFYGIYFTKVTMRTSPTLSQTTGTNYYNLFAGNATDAFDSIGAITAPTPNQVRFDVSSGIASTNGFGAWIQTNNAAAFVALQAEL